ncbi:MAG TPA: arylsulfatase [Pirellulaceae bacterium]|nr:arylsulfatase [Pirellulaceae bacterium]
MRSLALLAATLLSFDSLAAAPRPNIVVIMSDDMGYSDIGCYGGEISTPTLDKLAAGGLRFTQFYNTARCCPTRAALLTGLYPHQAGIGHMMEDRGLDAYRGDLNRRCATIAEVLRPAGYGTYAVGKWHVTKAARPEGPKDNWPLQRGFDRFYGTITGAGNFYDPGTLTRDNTMISPQIDKEYQPKQYYYTDAISDNAARYIADHHRQSAEKPLFLYVAYTAAHWPMHALEEDIAKYKGTYDAGYEPIRRARFERTKKLGLISSDAQLSATAGNWNSVENKAWEARCMEVYAAMIDRMDHGIGRIVAELEKTGRLNNTLICFLQDNGGCAETVGRQPAMGVPTLRPSQPPLPPQGADFIDTAVRPTRTRDGYQVRMGPGAMPGPGDTFIAYGQGWANVSNTPLREYKHWVHEGGISTPLVVHWPAGIERRGQLEPQPGHLIDLMATCVAVSGAEYPPAGTTNVQPLEGRSLVPAFAGQPIQREAIYWEHEGNRAVRAGNWKLVAKGPAGKWELYDIDRDRAEQHDLADQQPDRVKQMTAQWEAWAKRAGAIPWIWQPQYGEPPTNGIEPKKTKAAKKGAKGKANP